MINEVLPKNTIAMKKLSIIFLSIVLLLFPFIRGQGQSTQSSIIWLRTGGAVAPGMFLETGDYYFMGATSERLNPDGTYTFDLTKISNVFYKTDKNLVVLDSVLYEYQDDDRHFISRGVFLLDNGQILLCGSGYIPYKDEYQLGLRWMNTSLEIVRDTMISIDDFQMGDIESVTINQEGNFLAYGRKVRENPTEVTRLYFIEFDQEGTVLDKVVQANEESPSFIAPMKDGKYHMYKYENQIVQLNSDFTPDKSFELNLPPYYHMWSLIPYTEDSYFLTGRYYAHFLPDYIMTDLAYVHIDYNGNVLNTLRYGFEMESSEGPSLSYCDPETLYVGGTRNVYSESLDSLGHSAIFIHKINLNGDILQTTHFETDKPIRAGMFFATSDGGCLISGMQYDYESASCLYSDGFFIKMEADGSILGLPESWEYTQNREFQVFPNPVKDKLQIVSTNGKSMDYTRGILYNSSGIQLKSFEFRAETVQDLSDLAAGIYALQLIKQNGNFETVKLIVNPGN